MGGRWIISLEFARLTETSSEETSFIAWTIWAVGIRPGEMNTIYLLARFLKSEGSRGQPCERFKGSAIYIDISFSMNINILFIIEKIMLPTYDYKILQGCTEIA